MPAGIVVQVGGRDATLIVWSPEQLSSLEPESGKIFWQEPFK